MRETLTRKSEKVGREKIALFKVNDTIGTQMNCVPSIQPVTLVTNGPERGFNHTRHIHTQFVVISLN